MVAALVLLLLPLAPNGRVGRALMDLCHGPLFAIIAGGTCWAFRGSPSPKTRAAGVWIFCAGLGLSSEVLQHWVGRQPSWHDVRANLLGTTAGVLWMNNQIAGRSKIGSRLFAGLLLVGALLNPAWILADAASQALEMPSLASFEFPWELSRWSVQDCRIQRVRQHSTSGDWALQVDFDRRKYPGLAIPEVPPNWTFYREIAFDVTLEAPDSLNLIVKITDEAHNWESNDRFHYQAHLTSGLNRIRILLRDVQQAPESRLMDLSRMRMLQFFLIDPKTPARIYLDNIRLIPDDFDEDTATPDPNGLILGETPCE